MLLTFRRDGKLRHSRLLLWIFQEKLEADNSLVRQGWLYHWVWLLVFSVGFVCLLASLRPKLVIRKFSKFQIEKFNRCWVLARNEGRSGRLSLLICQSCLSVTAIVLLGNQSSKHLPPEKKEMGQLGFFIFPLRKTVLRMYYSDHSFP